MYSDNILCSEVVTFKVKTKNQKLAVSYFAECFNSPKADFLTSYSEKAVFKKSITPPPYITLPISTASEGGTPSKIFLGLVENTFNQQF